MGFSDVFFVEAATYARLDTSNTFTGNDLTIYSETVFFGDDMYLINETGPAYFVIYSESATSDVGIDLETQTGGTFRLSTDYLTPSFKLFYTTNRVVWNPLLTIQSDGDVCFGCENPNYRIHVVGQNDQVFHIESTANTASIFAVGNGDSTFVAKTQFGRSNLEFDSPNSIWQISGRQSTNDITIRHTTLRPIPFADPVMTIKSNGYIAMGGETPLHHLHVKGSGEQMVSVQSTDGRAAVDLQGGSTYRYQWSNEPPATGSLVLNHYNGSVWVSPPRLTVSSSGYLGINVTTPDKILDIGGDTVKIRTPRTIGSGSADGIQGEICWDAGYIYVCVATNSWKRSSLSVIPG
jgi:hypothetical protein